MERFLWRALRVGDRVYVHDPVDGISLMSGVVTMLDGTDAARPVVCAIGPEHDRQIVRPARLSTHLDPIDSQDDCWRCDQARSSWTSTVRRHVPLGPEGAPREPSTTCQALDRPNPTVAEVELYEIVWDSLYSRLAAAPAVAHADQLFHIERLRTDPLLGFSAIAVLAEIGAALVHAEAVATAPLGATDDEIDREALDVLRTVVDRCFRLPQD
jgi:hypothetical protein